MIFKKERIRNKVYKNILISDKNYGDHIIIETEMKKVLFNSYTTYKMEIKKIGVIWKITVKNGILVDSNTMLKKYNVIIDIINKTCKNFDVKYELIKKEHTIDNIKISSVIKAYSNIKFRLRLLYIKKHSYSCCFEIPEEMFPTDLKSIELLQKCLFDLSKECLLLSDKK